MAFGRASWEGRGGARRAARQAGCAGGVACSWRGCRKGRASAPLSRVRPDAHTCAAPHLCGVALGVPVDAGADGRERDVLEAVLVGQRKAAPEARAEQGSCEQEVSIPRPRGLREAVQLPGLARRLWAHTSETEPASWPQLAPGDGARLAQRLSLGRSPHPSLLARSLVCRREQRLRFLCALVARPHRVDHVLGLEAATPGGCWVGWGRAGVGRGVIWRW